MSEFLGWVGMAFAIVTCAFLWAVALRLVTLP